MKKILLLFFIPLYGFSLNSVENQCLFAVKHPGHSGAVEKLCHRSVVSNLNFLDENQVPPLYYAIANNDNKSLRFLLENGANPSIKTSTWADSMHIAAIFNRVSMVPLLIKYGAKIDSLDADSNTPLMLAAEQGHLQFVQLAFLYGAHLNQRNQFNQTAFLLATQRGQIAAMSFLYQHKVKMNLVSYIDGNMPVHEAAIENQSGALDFLKKHHINLNAQSQYTGMTPLLYSIVFNAKESFRYLIANQVNINLWDFEHNTPLHWVARMNQIEMLDVLLLKGADTTIKNKDGITAKDIAKNKGYWNIYNKI